MRAGRIKEMSVSFVSFFSDSEDVLFVWDYEICDILPMSFPDSSIAFERVISFD